MKADENTSNSPKNIPLIWSNLKKGDSEALGILYDLYIDELVSYGMSFANDKSQVLDSIHDLFVDLYKYRSKLVDTDNVKYYLLKSLKRKIFKNNKRKELPFISELSGLNTYFLDNHTKSIEEKILFSEAVKERSLRLIKALNSLTKKQREGLSLRYGQDRSYEEIAQILGISVASARTSIYRAIKLLREHHIILLISFNFIFL